MGKILFSGVVRDISDDGKTDAEFAEFKAEVLKDETAAWKKSKWDRKVAEWKRVFNQLPLDERKDAVAEGMEVYLEDNYGATCEYCDEHFYTCDEKAVKIDDLVYCSQECSDEDYQEWLDGLSPAERRKAIRYAREEAES